MAVAEAVPGGRLADLVAELGAQRDGLLAREDRAAAVTEPGVVPADRVEGSTLTGPVAGRQEQIEGVLGVAKCPQVVAGQLGR